MKYVLFILAMSEVLSAAFPPELFNKMQGNPGHVVVNIVTPPDGLGGFGDLVSNLYMGEQLKKEGIKVNIFVDRNFLDKFQTLKIFETVDVQGTYLGEKNGIDYFWAPSSEVVDGAPWRDQIPSPDEYTVYTTFSSLNLFYPYQKTNFHSLKYFLPADTSNQALLFGEYMGQKQVMPLLARARPTVRRGAGLMTGPLALGMYIAREKPEILGNKTALIREYFRTDLSDDEIQNDNVKLGYSYTKGSHATELYLEALAKFATEHPNQQFFIVTKWLPRGLENPSNLHVVVIEQMPFSRTKELISVANMPIMVTGDMSLTLAMEYEKEFFYEKLDHKFEIENELRLFDELNELKAISVISYSEGLGAESTIIPDHMKSGEREKIYAGFNWFLEHPTYMARGLHAIRERISLPARFLEIVRHSNEPRELLKLTTVASNPMLWQNALATWSKTKNWEQSFTDNQEWIGTRAWLLGDLETQGIKYELVFSDDKLAGEYKQIVAQKKNTNAYLEKLKNLLFEASDKVRLVIKYYDPFDGANR